ncbi:hypothetical protein AUQ43_15165 [Thalassospira sp. MCCC 1A01148]|uniref:N-acetyltransferase domain-containing protein n=1 Tax=Thalassospira profundimaris TaxID=502049 RepID=A0A367VD02_9PROT|nr:hypothetical protein AUQ43_15165 [Thalassospira sp. MCCC 1A01148]RCK23108.1 hypothetical protein TH6_08725 [Thalassospira profundimaris]
MLVGVKLKGLQLAIGFSILSKAVDVYKFVTDCREAADTERLALGFLPEAAYQQAAEQGKLFVAVSSGGAYLGHLMFGGVFPYVRVMQTYCVAECRHLGVGKSLISTLVSWAETRGYLSITARVASDLVAANKFYENSGFETVRSERGGKVRNRTILTKVLDLDTPNLFDLMGDQRQASVPSLGLKSAFSGATPLYAIDLNVLFDFSKGRPREKEAQAVLKAALNHEFQAALTDEFPKELLRTSYNPDDDTMLKLCALFSEIPDVRDKDELRKLKGLQNDLARLVFPDRARSATLTKQDISDLRHLSLCIIHAANGFITSEKAILRARDRLLENYQLDVLSVSDFAESPDDEFNRGLEFRSDEITNVEISIVDAKAVSKAEVEGFFDIVLLSEGLRSALLKGWTGLTGAHCQAVKEGNKLVAMMTWKAERRGPSATSVKLVASETSGNTKAVVDGLLGKLCENLSKHAPAILELEIPVGHAKTREVALSLGFRPDDEDKTSRTVFHKISYGKVITSNLWSQFRADLIALAKIKLPEQPPKYESASQVIEYRDAEDNLNQLSLAEFETLLSPLILLLPHRDGLIVPIRRYYADDLLGTSDQLSLLGDHSASIHSSRVYYSRPNKTIQPNSVIIFYESSAGNGRSSAVAIANATQVRELTSAQIAVETNRFGVVRHSELKNIGKSPRKLTLLCSSIVKFNDIVSYSKLCKLGCNNGARFVTATRISHNELLKVVAAGGLNGANG